ncbi:hypothetical protein N9X24_02440 [Rickettsiales bacterium]|nr:hypothetical protein [Rickettsiales bacterium]
MYLVKWIFFKLTNIVTIFLFKNLCKISIILIIFNQFALSNEINQNSSKSYEVIIENDITPLEVDNIEISTYKSKQSQDIKTNKIYKLKKNNILDIPEETEELDEYIKIYDQVATDNTYWVCPKSNSNNLINFL